MEEETGGLVVPINKDVRIYAIDSFNFCIQYRKTVQSGKNAGNDYWTSEYYFGTLEAACQKVLTLGIRQSKATSVDSIIIAVQSARDEITNAIRGNYAEIKTLSKK